MTEETGAIRKRPFFLAAMLLAVVAFMMHGIARDHLDKNMKREALHMTQAVQQHVPYVRDPRFVQESRNYNRLYAIGFGLTILSVICAAIAAIRREPGWYVFLMLILLFDIVVPMLL